MFLCLDTKGSQDEASSSKSLNSSAEIHDKGKIVDEGIHHADECERKNGGDSNIIKLYGKSGL